MTRDQAVAQIKLQLSFRQTLDSEIVQQLQFAQTNLESAPTKPWFLISEDTFTSTTINEERVVVPPDFLCECEEATLKYRPSDWPTSDEVDLNKDIYDVLRQEYAGVEAGPPEAYALLGDYFRVFPLCDAVYQLRLIYYKKALVLDTNIENVWLKYAPLVLMGSAGMLIAGGPVRDKTAYDIFRDWVATGAGLVKNQDVTRQMANFESQIGGRHW